MFKYELVFIDDKISFEDFSRQSGIPLSKIKDEMVKNSIKGVISIKDSKKIIEIFPNIKIINNKNNESRLRSLKEIHGNDQRIPTISIMGHIDHGKTTLVDKIMSTHKVEKESGGITQNISLYKINHFNKEFFLIDTPGHQVFTDIRKFIINNSDILVLLVAADDGVNEQTIEIIKQSTDIEKIICINKIDRGIKNLDKIYHKLSELGVLSNEYGGETLTCKISAKTGEGIDNLIETILLSSDYINFKADKKQDGIGYIIDSYQKRGIGLITRILLKTGKISVGDKFLSNNTDGIIKRIFINDKQVNSANYNDLIDIVGFNDIPEPGGDFFIINDDNLRSDLGLYFKSQKKIEESLHNEVVFIIKAENTNQLTTLSKALNKKGKVLIKSIGEITDSDINTGKLFNCIFAIWGNIPASSIEKIKKEKLRYVKNDIIYNIIDEITVMLEKPIEIKYKTTAKINVLKVFNIKGSCIAGCKIIEGNIKKGNKCKILRNNELMIEANISSMKREKDNITEAICGSECGLLFNKNFDFLIGDTIEVIEEDK